MTNDVIVEKCLNDVIHCCYDFDDNLESYYYVWVCTWIRRFIVWGFFIVISSSFIYLLAYRVLLINLIYFSFSSDWLITFLTSYYNLVEIKHNVLIFHSLLHTHYSSYSICLLYFKVNLISFTYYYCSLLSFFHIVIVMG